MGQNQVIKCPKCNEDLVVKLKEFVDVALDPIYKEQLLAGDFFMVKCDSCGDETIIEYPMMYIDSSKKLNIYMAPDHEENLLDNLNSLEVPDGDLDPEAIYRVVDNSAELIEKIIIVDSGRDDRILQLYKMIICENTKEELPGMEPSDLLYIKDGSEEYFVIWTTENEDGDRLSADLDEELYIELERDFGDALETEPNKYVKVDKEWILSRIEIAE